MRDRFYQSAAWRTLRFEALRRDRWKCARCGCRVRSRGSARVTHILPRSERPDLQLVLRNLRVLCVACDDQPDRSCNTTSIRGGRREKDGRHVERMPVELDGLSAAWR